MSNNKTCPYCCGEIKVEAIKCKHCHSMLDEQLSRKSSTMSGGQEGYRAQEPARTDPTVEYLRERDRKIERDKTIHALVTVIVLVALGIYFYPSIVALGDLFAGEESPATEEAAIEEESISPAYSLFAKDLMNEYRENEVAADNKYKNEVIEVWGVVERISSGTFADEMIISLKSGVRLRDIAEEYEEIVMDLKPGDEIKARGRCRGMTLSSVYFRDVVLMVD